jgi:CheY-like chemotaxis protein/LmbE family N-acetylglucosaminyl deacetylase
MSDSHPPTRPDPPGRILVVEDDPDHARFVIEVLQNRGGFQVTHTVDPSEVLGRLREPWDLVLTDVEMPGMTGLQLLESVRRVAPDLPVAVVTAHATMNNVVTALRGRADEFLQKPLLPERLLAVASTLAAKGRAARLASRQVVLAIGAHPDDAEIAAGGTLAVHHDLGHETVILTLCSAGPGEAAAAATVLGAELYLEDLQDTGIAEGDPTISVIARVVDAVQPTTIYTHSAHDVHQDHRNTHSAALVAARGIGRFYCFQSPSATVDFRPTRFVTIDGQLDRKLKAIASFDSLAELRTYLDPDLVQSIARSWSRFADGRYAEAFEVIRDRADIARGRSAEAVT